MGQQPEEPYRVNNNPGSIVERLILPISGTGRNVTCDTYPLISSLLHNHRRENSKKNK